MEMGKVRWKGGLELSRFLYLLFFFTLSEGEQTPVRADDVNKQDAFHLRGQVQNLRPLGSGTKFGNEVTYTRTPPIDVHSVPGGKDPQVQHKLVFRSALLEISA